MKFTPVWPHGDIHEIFENIFLVTGTNKIEHEGVNIQTSRNMIIVRDLPQDCQNKNNQNNQNINLINTVRLDPKALKKLDSLGTVTNIIRIGAFHGRDDTFYRDYYPKSTLWTLKGMNYLSGLQADRNLIVGQPMPFADCELFIFATSKLPEGILLIKREGGILISCDSIQNITATDNFYSAETAKSFQEQGLIKPANISPIWLGATETKITEFEKLLKTMSFRHLITAHGEPLRNTAFEQLSQTINNLK